MTARQRISELIVFAGVAATVLLGAWALLGCKNIHIEQSGDNNTSAVSDLHDETAKDLQLTPNQ